MSKNTEIQVMGRRWDTSRANFFTAIEGMTLEKIVTTSLHHAYKDHTYTVAQYKQLLKYARVRLNGEEIPREKWKDILPTPNDTIEILHGVRGGGGGGGGGGKNPLGTILSVIVVVIAAVATWYLGGLGGAAAANVVFGLSAAQCMVGVGLMSAAALYAINALFPASTPKLGGFGSTDIKSVEKESPTYNINGGKNTHNVNGYVPMILGKHRFTPPLGAKSWTTWKGETQYFNMLVVWGHPDIVVSDFRIGETPLDKFTGVTHRFLQSTTGGNLKYFGKQYTETSVGTTLYNKNGWVQRTVGEANDLSIDITFPGGLTAINKNNGNRGRREVEFEIQFKPTVGGSWQGFATTIGKNFGEAWINYSFSETDNAVSVFYKDGKLQAVKRGQTVSGGICIFPKASGISYMSGCNIGVWPSGSQFGISVSAGYFNYNGTRYNVKAETLWITAPIEICVNVNGGVQKGNNGAVIYPAKGSGTSGGDCSWSNWYERWREWKYVNWNTRWHYDESSNMYTDGNGNYLDVPQATRRRNNYYYESDYYDYGYYSDSYYDGGYIYDNESNGYGYLYGYWNGGELRWEGWRYVYTSHHVGWTCYVRGGTAQVPSGGWAKIGSSKQKQVVKNYEMTGLPLKSYDVRIRRVTGDTSDSYIIDEAQWATMRAIIDKPAFDTPVPICVSELRIKANEQLNGYVTEFNALCSSNIPDWNASTKTWVKKETANPASIMRYLLTSRHSLINPFAAKRLDNTALVDLWTWCNKNGYRFDFVADSEENLWSRLVQVLAPAMAAPTTDVDGKWGAIIDKPDKTVRQMFTPRNSWGMQIQRGFAKLPDALRVSFIDETDDYKQKQGFVYNDGFNKDGSGGNKKANDVIEWDFPGVANWKRMYTLARYHLAQMIHRQSTVTINTDWEWLAVHRGDLVGLSSDVLMNTFGTARVLRKVYMTNKTKVVAGNNSYIVANPSMKLGANAVLEAIGPHDAVPSGGTLVGIEIDDTVVYSAPKPARYGIAVRSSVVKTSGMVNTLEITPDYGNESSILYFADKTKAAKTPPDFGDLISVALLTEEYEEYLVASIEPSDNMSAQLTLVPYKTKEIRQAASGKIPEYKAPVTLDMVKISALPTPNISQVRSDETAAVLLESGAVQVRIAAWWKVPPSSEVPTTFTVHLECTDKDTGAVVNGSGPSTETYVAVSGVTVGHTYYCRIRISDPANGRTSEWSAKTTHKVTGLVAPPPVPQNVKAVLSYPEGIRLTWSAVNIVDLSHYVITGSASGRTRGKETEYVHVPKKQTGTLTFNVWSQDTTNHRSKSAGVATVKVAGPKKPVITSARLENEGIIVEYQNAQGTWPVTSYLFTCRTSRATSTALRCVVPFPKGFQRGDAVKGHATDYFLNVGEDSEREVEIIPPATHEVTIGVNADGTAAFKWQNCRTVTDIKHYRLEGACEGTSTGLTATLPVKDILWTTIEENGVTYRIGTITEYVTAVDKYGFESERGGKSFSIYPPYNPILSMRKTADGLALTWQNCKRTFNIKHYVVYDKYFDETYVVDGTSQLLKPRPVGYYDFSVIAYDVIDNYSSEMWLFRYEIGGVGLVHPTATIDGADILLKWNVPATSWPIDDYIITNQAGVTIGRSKTTYFRFPAPIAGSYEYGVRGRDIAGNLGQEQRAAITINLPAAPVVNAILAGDGVTVSWEAGDGTNTLPVAAWDMVRQWETVREGDGIIETHEQDYGRLDVNTLSVPAISTGEHSFMVRAVDTAGNVGAWGYVDFEVSGPGKVTFMNCATVDNNVMLYWTEPDRIFFPIEYYLFEEIERYGDVEYAMEIGRIDALFASSFETESGEFLYGITPVDTAGNRGTRTTILMRVAQPPDFILYHDYDSLFNGTKTNFVLDGRGKMIGPYADATWNENLAAIAQAENLESGDDLTWEDKIGYGYENWLDPSASSATYLEIVDIGKIVPSTKITVTIDSIPLSGNPRYSCEIAVSSDGEEWRIIGDDALMVYATNFRYARYTIGLTGGTAAISNINYKLDVKRKSDYGNVVSNATDNGDGWVDMATTPMLTGTWVPFNTSFTDVESLPRPNVTAVYDSQGNGMSLSNLTGYTAYVVFQDVLNPTGFRVFVLDANGNRVSAQVDWCAFGV